jgi:hypothetical protein
MELTFEVNAEFKEADTTVHTPTGGVVLITPPLTEKYYVARVPLYKDQAIVIFPKFGMLGCGFAQETDWNTNLPVYEHAEKIYAHIRHNKKYAQISEENCVYAIKLLQAWVKEQGMWL